MKWKQVDVYASGIRKLVALAGISGDAMERIVRLAFVTGFLHHISISLLQLHGIQFMSMR